MAVPVWSGAQILAQMGSGHYWGGTTITYSTTSTAGLVRYSGSLSAYDNTVEHNTYSGGLNSSAGNSAALVMTLWDDLIPQSLVRVDETLGSNANIDFAGLSDATTKAQFAYTLTNYNPAQITGATVWLNNTYNSGTNNLVNPVIGDYGFTTYVHEIGHALGLDHPGNYFAAGGPAPSSYQDSLVYTVMSYFGPESALGGQNLGVAWANWLGFDPQTPMLNDIFVMQSIYGISATTRTGDTIYGFHSTVGGAQGVIYDFAQNSHPILCIVDSSGTDTLDLSGDANSDLIDLHSGAFSSVMGLTNNVSIAFSCTIENAVGGSGNDTIIGNDAGNVLFGGAGHDSITGGNGNDYLVGGASYDYLNGGGGVNTVSYADSSAAVTVNLFYHSATGGDAQGDYITNIQTVVGSNFADLIVGDDGQNWLIGGGGADTLLGGSGNDFLFGGAGNDVLYGGDGNDYLIGGAGYDYLNGEGGANTVVYSDSTAGVTVNLVYHSATGGDAQGDYILNCVGVVGSDFADLLVGDASQNWLYGGGGADTLIGGGGNDYLNGGAGNDSFVFNSTNFGRVEITDFTIGADKVQISTSLAANFNVLSLASSGANTVIALGADSIIIDNLSPAQLHSSDFIFA